MRINHKHPNLLKILKHGLFPLFFYFLMFCLLTFPLIFKFNTYFFADTGDGLQNIWNLWWVNLVVHWPNKYPSIWQTTLLHWPFGTTLVGQTLNPFNGFLAVPLRMFLSLTATHNVIFIFSFVMGGMTMYWLAQILTRSFWGSIIAGFTFTFSSYHFMHAQGHLQLVSLEWVPLFVLCWYSLITRPRTITAVGSAIVLWMVLLCDNYYFFYSVLIGILIVVWFAIINRNVGFIVKKEHFIPLATFMVIALLLITPIVGPLLISNYRDPLLGSHNPYLYSLDLLSIILPGGHWFFNQWTQFFWSKLPGNINESSVYLGLSTFIVMGYVWVKRKTEEFAAKQQIYLWSAITGFFFILSLGPALQIGGKIIWDKIMPYTILVKILPPLQLSGMPVRMTVMVILGASILTAFGFRAIFRQFPKKKIFTFALLGILLFETLPKPLPATMIEVPDYITALAHLPNDGGVVDLVTQSASLELYYQTIHGKPIAFGYVSRLPTSVNVKDSLLSEAIGKRDYGKLWDTYHIRYIITHDTLLAQSSEPEISVEIIYDRNDIKIYRIGCTCE
jgi:hypothetical protein